MSTVSCQNEFGERLGPGASNLSFNDDQPRPRRHRALLKFVRPKCAYPHSPVASLSVLEV